MNFKSLFYPKSIAVVGASREEKTVGNDIVKNLVKQGYKGKIYPVNPKANKLYGLKVYKAISDIKSKVDLSVIAIPAKYVLEAAKESHKIGAEAIAVISSGFKEVGEKEREEKLKQFCQSNDIALLGPNCLGVINSEISMNASFAAIMPKLGPIAFASQSGALCATVLDYAQNLGLGFSKFLSIGNKTIIDEISLLEYFAQDQKTKVIALYSEQLKNAPKIIKVVRQITSGKNPKPVIILKSGVTAAGSKAVASHTGSIGGGDTAYDALIRQAGMIRASTTGELFDLLAIFSENQLQEVKNTAIITNAGGPGVMSTDAAINAGLKLAKLSASTQEKLKSLLPQSASIKNPIDILGDADAKRYQEALELVAKDEQVDSLIVILTPQSMTEVDKTAQAIAKLKKKINKPIVVNFMGQSAVDKGVDIMEKAGLSTTQFPEEAGKTLADFGKFAKKTQLKPSAPIKASQFDSKEVAKIFVKAKEAGQLIFPESQALPILKAYNFDTLKFKIATSAQEAAKIAPSISDNLAIKIVSKDILHKSDAGGLVLNVKAKDAAKTYQQLIKNVTAKKPEAKIEGALLMEMAADSGIEMILGINKIPDLGTVILVGMGGIYVEIIKDLQMAFVPLTEKDISYLIGKLKMHEVLKGARGQKAFDIKAVKAAIRNLNQLVLDFPEITELDINPLMVFPQGQGAKALDARIVIE